MDLLYLGFLLHKKNNKTNYGFKLCWIVHFFLFNRFFVGGGRGGFCCNLLDAVYYNLLDAITCSPGH